MINIKNFEIVDEGQNLMIDLETNLNFIITSVKLWSMNTFKDDSLAIDLNYKLEQINNKESFTVSASEISVSNFEDIYFIEVLGNYNSEECENCRYPALGITYNLGAYYKCLMNYILDNSKLECFDLEDLNTNIVITINLLIDSVKNSIEIGLYNEAILMIQQLKKLCSIKKCNDCRPVNCVSCSGFKQF